jgi:hypothetical protein
MPSSRPLALAAILVALLTLSPIHTASAAAEIGLGFGGYSMVDFEPLTAATISVSAPKFLFTGSFALRTGEDVTNVLVGVKAHAVVKEKGSTELGVGGTFSLLTDAFFADETVIGLGFGGGVQHWLGDSVSLTADIYPLALQINGGTRFGLLSSGALGVNYYFGSASGSSGGR